MASCAPYCTEAFAADELREVRNRHEAETVAWKMVAEQTKQHYGGALTLAGNIRQDGSIANGALHVPHP